MEGALERGLGPTIANDARRTSNADRSLRDVQLPAGHFSLQTTKRYIEGDAEASQSVVNLV